MSTHHATPEVIIGDRVTVQVGGVTTTCTIGAFVFDRNKGWMFRSTTDTDHVFTQMWMTLGCIKDES